VVKISARILTVLNEVFCGFPQFLQTNAMIIPSNTPWLFPPRSFQVHWCDYARNTLINISVDGGPVLGPVQPPIHWVQGALSLGVKRPGREAHHSPPVSVEVKNTWIYTSMPPYIFIA
jgi:hypothetical protein